MRAPGWSSAATAVATCLRAAVWPSRRLVTRARDGPPRVPGSAPVLRDLHRPPARERFFTSDHDGKRTGCIRGKAEHAVLFAVARRSEEAVHASFDRMLSRGGLH